MFGWRQMERFGGQGWVRGKQTAMFCTNNAGTHVFELSVNDQGNIAGFLRFNQVEYIPVDLQTGGSVDGLDECYMNEGSA